MKKLISVFAALALVGSLAAQKGKKPAKAPAKPAVAAPAVPAAVTTAAAIAPKPAGGKGMGLFIEGRFGYSLSNGSSSSNLTGDGSATITNYQLSNAAGLSYGGTIGYQIVESLGIVAGFDYRSIKSREWSASNSNSLMQTANPLTVTGGSLNGTLGTAAGSTSTLKNTKNTMIVTLGFRPSVKLGPGDLFAGAGAALILPYDSTTNASATYTGAIASHTVETIKSYNMSIGGYGEIGYNFSITDKLYIGLGARVVVATANNDGKNTTIKGTYTGGSYDVTLKNGTSVDGSATTTTTSGTATTITSQNRYESDGTTDITGVVNVGFRF